MQKFISAIKNVSPEWLIFELSEISRTMFQQDMFVFPIDVPIITKNGVSKTLTVQLSPMDIQTMEYLSICNSNDYRYKKEDYNIGKLVDLYRDYDNENSSDDVGGDKVFIALFGMVFEQSMYQNQRYIFEQYNRNYHILIASKNINRKLTVSTEKIILQKFGCSVDEFISVLCIMVGLCIKHANPLAALETLDKKYEKILTTEKVNRFIEYYSCNYDDIRKSKIGKQILYSKPFIKTDRNKLCLVSNLYLVLLSLSSCFYWITRDFFCKKDSLEFVNAFGYMFEDYIAELAEVYCKPTDWKRLPEGKEKNADFHFTLHETTFLIESKTVMLGLSAKQQVPDVEVAITFMKRCIDEAYKQLQSGIKLLSAKEGISKVIKIILVYENIANHSLLEFAVSDIFNKDPNCFIMTIHEFEILLYLHKNKQETCRELFTKITMQSERKNIGIIYNEMELYKYSHFMGERDYFSQSFKKVKDILE